MTASADISDLSDAELTARCKRNRAEEWLHQSGCVVGLLAGVAAGVTAITLGAAVASWDWCFAAYLGFMAFFVTGLSTFSLCEGLSRFRCRHYLREVEGRYGLLPLKDYVKAMRPGLTPGETVFVFVGQGLPHGDHWWVCVHTFDGGKAGKAEVRRVATEGFGGRPDFGKGVVPTNALQVARTDLPPELASRLAETAGRLHRPRINVRSAVIDGFPVACAVLDGATQRATVISCNLVGVPSSQAGEPHIRLLHEVFAVGTALLDGPSVYGSTDFFTGEIRLGDLRTDGVDDAGDI
jgi:hypothetical protein